MSDSNPLVRVHVNIEVSPTALQEVVANSKRKAETQDEARSRRVDTADALASLISKFLREKGFDQFAADIDNY